ncbi:MAG: hypothetical protein VKJ64_18350 [Leptolyngbyaceae bacterium]|nr:hypothetical protein [Leptolyngbyaceae bacterium]
MTTATLATIIKMVESLPDNMQERLVEHIREFIADLEDENQWDEAFERSQSSLVAAARKAKQEIAAGQAIPMNYDQL